MANAAILAEEMQSASELDEITSLDDICRQLNGFVRARPGSRYFSVLYRRVKLEADPRAKDTLYRQFRDIVGDLARNAGWSSENVQHFRRLSMLAIDMNLSQKHFIHCAACGGIAGAAMVAGCSYCRHSNIKHISGRTVDELFGLPRGDRAHWNTSLAFLTSLIACWERQ